MTIHLIDTPGLYDVSEHIYHADPCKMPSLSCSIGKKLINQTPRHAWHAHPRLNPDYEPENRQEFDLGKTSHKIMLGKGAELVLIDFKNYQKKEAKEKRDAAYEAGHIPVLPHQLQNAERMVAAGRAQLRDHEDASQAFTNGKPEVMLVWQEGDVWCRCLLDWMPNKGRVFLDYKTTQQSANPEIYRHTLFNLGLDFQSAFYRRGIRKVLGISDPVFEFVVQEIQEPHALSVIGLPPSAIDDADADVQRAIDLWNACLSENRWPGYPRRTCYVEPPARVIAQRLDREVRDDLAAATPDKDLLRQLVDWQAPLDQGDAA